MSEEKVIVLEVDYGNIKAGDTLVVVKENPSTTIVQLSSGKRMVIPNKCVKGGTTTTSEPVELSREEWDGLYLPLKAGGSVEEVVGVYIMWAEITESEATLKAISIVSGIAKGKEFLKPTPKIHIKHTTPVGTEFSSEEREVLEGILKGEKAWDSEEVAVTSDTVELPPEETPTLGEDQIWFTDITGGRKPKSGINHIVQRHPTSHFPEGIRIDIPKVDPDHYWDTEVLEALIIAHDLRERALLTGLPGTGKTTSVEQLAAWIRQPYMRLGGRGDLETSSLLGYSWVDTVEKDGKMMSNMVFKPGMLTQGVEQGYLVTIDEVMKIPAHIQMCMQHLYEKGGHLTVDDKPGTKEDKIILPAPEFFMVLTDNVKGTGDDFDKFSATMMQDTSMLDRVSINETVNYLPAEAECKMLLSKFPSADKGVVRKLVKFAGLVRNGYKAGEIALTLSPRGLIGILGMLSKHIPIVRSIELVFINKIADEAEEISIRAMLKTVGIS